MVYVRLELHLKEPPLQLNSAMRRLYSRLAVQAEAYNRLTTLDDCTEVLQDLYKLAAGRLDEYHCFQDGLRVEWLVVATLLLEAGLGLQEL